MMVRGLGGRGRGRGVVSKLEILVRGSFDNIIERIFEWEC